MRKFEEKVGKKNKVRMEEDVLNALKTKLLFPGGSDKDANVVLITEVPHNLQPLIKLQLDLSIKYLISAYR